MEVLIPTQLRLLAPTKSMGHKAPYTHPTCEQIETLGFSDAKVVPRMWVPPFLYKSSRFSWSAQHFHGLDTISSLMNNYIHDTREVGYQLFRPHNPISWEIVWYLFLSSRGWENLLNAADEVVCFQCTLLQNHKTFCTQSMWAEDLLPYLRKKKYKRFLKHYISQILNTEVLAKLYAAFSLQFCQPPFHFQRAPMWEAHRRWSGWQGLDTSQCLSSPAMTAHQTVSIIW